MIFQNRPLFTLDRIKIFLGRLRRRLPFFYVRRTCPEIASGGVITVEFLVSETTGEEPGRASVTKVSGPGRQGKDTTEHPDLNLKPETKVPYLTFDNFNHSLSPGPTRLPSSFRSRPGRGVLREEPV